MQPSGERGRAESWGRCVLAAGWKSRCGARSGQVQALEKGTSMVLLVNQIQTTEDVMLNRMREVVFAALAAVMLTLGTVSVASASAGCMEWCREHFGDSVEYTEWYYEEGDDYWYYEETTWELGLESCTESGSNEGSTYTCTYSN